MTLTTLFWQWSGMASLGTFYLILGAPILLGLIANNLKKIRNNSKHHQWIYKLSISYFVIAPITFLLLISIYILK